MKETTPTTQIYQRKHPQVPIQLQSWTSAFNVCKIFNYPGLGTILYDFIPQQKYH